MQSPSNPFQVALFTRLDAAVTADVYDYVPQDAALPYVRIGIDDVEMDDTQTSDMVMLTATIHCFAEGEGFKAVKTIADEVRNALHNKENNLSVSGWDVVTVRVETEQYIEHRNDAGGDLYQHCIMRVMSRLWKAAA